MILCAQEKASAFYSPDTGRWLNRDPIQEAGGLNLYDYVHNNPVSQTDLLGLEIMHYPIAPNGEPTVEPPNVQVGPAFGYIAGVGGIGLFGAEIVADLGVENGIVAAAWAADQLMRHHDKKKDCPPKNGSGNQPMMGMAKRPDIKFIDYLQKKYGLSDPQREQLHEEITGQNLSKSEIEEIVKSFVEEFPEGLPPIE